MNKLLVIGLGLAAMAYASKGIQTPSTGVVPAGTVPVSKAIVSAAQVLPYNPTGAQFVKVSEISKAQAQASLLGAQAQYKSLRVKYLDPISQHMARLRELIRARKASGLTGPTTQRYIEELAGLKTEYDSRYAVLLAPIQAQIDKFRTLWRRAR